MLPLTFGASDGVNMCSGNHLTEEPADHTVLCLPEELLLNVFSRLSQEERKPLSSVCRDFRRIASDESFWKIFARTVGISIDKLGLSEIPNKARNELIVRIESTKDLP
ncbi:MAG: hypothetical protein KR126chlam1_00644, partial [Chlamydiae bacterium]|nr:hypothetical protein [Chlamydiota bacterium]